MGAARGAARAWLGRTSAAIAARLPTPAASCEQVRVQAEITRTTRSSSRSISPRQLGAGRSYHGAEATAVVHFRLLLLKVTNVVASHASFDASITRQNTMLGGRYR